MNWVASALDTGGSEATPKFPALHTVLLLPLRPLTSCSLAPSSLSLPHPGTSAGRTLPRNPGLHVALEPICVGRTPLSLHQLLPQLPPHLLLGPQATGGLCL